MLSNVIADHSISIQNPVVEASWAFKAETQAELGSCQQLRVQMFSDGKDFHIPPRMHRTNEHFLCPPHFMIMP